MRFGLSICICLWFLHASAQDADFFWQRQAQKRDSLIALPPVLSSTHNFLFRLDNGSRVLDCGRDSSGRIYAQLVLWAREIVPSNEAATDRIYREVIDLPDSVANSLLNWYQTSGIRLVPTQDSILNWTSGLDGIEFLLEVLDHGRYYFRCWWTPTAFPNVPMAQVVQHFSDSAYVLAKTTQVNQFSSRVPFYSWANGPGGVITKVTSWPQYQQYRKERQRYRKQQRKRKADGNKSQ
jgi:hypothetical protein